MSANRTVFPILKELNLSSNKPKEKRPKASDILQYLLETNAVTEEQVRQAHHVLTRQPISPSSNFNSSLSENPPTVRTRHVALKIYYDGSNYSGLAENVGDEKDQSVEKQVFAALVKTKLVQSRETSGYSRCGRTDKGVSAAGQVIALNLKSAFAENASWDAEGTQRIEDERLPKNSTERIEVYVPSRKAGKPRQCKRIAEYAYDKILNNILPDDIRVLAWSIVSPDFSARFSATLRTYRYFFVPREMNLVAMQQGLELLVGTHDFRNFCKIDVEKVYNFERKIYEARIEQMDDNVFYFEITGQAFLWHQIRCIASILFMIGRGLESPDIVTKLLDVETNRGKPAYPLADERHLVLHECGYNDLKMGFSVENLWHVVCSQEQKWQESVLAAARVRNHLNSLSDAMVRVDDLKEFCENKLRERNKKQKNVSNVIASPEPSFAALELVKWSEALEWMRTMELIPDPERIRETLHVPLLERSRGTTYEEKLEALQKSSKKRQKYEESVIKTRKTKEDDQAFYKHMTSQGGSAY